MLTPGRHVDRLGGMTESSSQTRQKPPRRIVGFSLSPQLAAKVKAEAGRRNISLRKLFEEMWALYEKSGKKPRP